MEEEEFVERTRDSLATFVMVRLRKFGERHREQSRAGAVERRIIG